MNDRSQYLSVVRSGALGILLPVITRKLVPERDAGSLRERCRAFLEREVPPGLGYVSDSIAEQVLAAVARGVPLDGELRELLPICVEESRSVAASLPAAARAYLLESAALLEEASRDGD